MGISCIKCAQTVGEVDATDGPYKMLPHSRTYAQLLVLQLQSILQQVRDVGRPACGQAGTRCSFSAAGHTVPDGAPLWQRLQSAGKPGCELLASMQSGNDRVTDPPEAVVFQHQLPRPLSLHLHPALAAKLFTRLRGSWLWRVEQVEL